LGQDCLTSRYAQENSDVIHSLFVGKIYLKGPSCNFSIATEKSLEETLKKLQIRVYPIQWCIPQILKWNWRYEDCPKVYGPKALFPEKDYGYTNYELLIRVRNYGIEYRRFMARPIKNESFNQNLKFYKHTY